MLYIVSLCCPRSLRFYSHALVQCLILLTLYLFVCSSLLYILLLSFSFVCLLISSAGVCRCVCQEGLPCLFPPILVSIRLALNPCERRMQMLCLELYKHSPHFIPLFCSPFPVCFNPCDSRIQILCLQQDTHHQPLSPRPFRCPPIPLSFLESLSERFVRSRQCGSVFPHSAHENEGEAPRFFPF